MLEFLVSESESIQGNSKTKSCVAAADDTLFAVMVAILRHTSENASLLGCHLIQQQVLDRQLCVLRQPVTRSLHTPRLHDGIEPTWQPQLCSAAGTHGSCGLQLGSDGVLESSRLALSLRPLLVTASSTFDLGRSEGSSRLLTLVPQGRVPWLTSHYRHRGHVLYELRTWSRWFSYSANNCAGGRPCPIAKVGATFPTCMSSSVLVLVRCSKVASKSMPESTDPRLNFRQRLARRRRRLRWDCAAIWSEHGDLDTPGCASVALAVLCWLAVGGASVVGLSLAKPRAASK